MNAEIAVVYRPRPGCFWPMSSPHLQNFSIWFYQHTSAQELGIRDYVNVFVKYEAGFVGGGGGGEGGGPPPSSLLTRAWELVFMADFLFFLNFIVLVR